MKACMSNSACRSDYEQVYEQVKKELGADKAELIRYAKLAAQQAGKSPHYTVMNILNQL